MVEHCTSAAPSSTSSSSMTLRSVCDVWDWREFTVHFPSPSDLEWSVACNEKMLTSIFKVTQLKEMAIFYTTRAFKISAPFDLPFNNLSNNLSQLVKFFPECGSGFWLKVKHLLVLRFSVKLALPALSTNQSEHISKAFSSNQELHENVWWCGLHSGYNLFLPDWILIR